MLKSLMNKKFNNPIILTTPPHIVAGILIFSGDFAAGMGLSLIWASVCLVLSLLFKSYDEHQIHPISEDIPIVPVYPGPYCVFSEPIELDVKAKSIGRCDISEPIELDVEAKSIGRCGIRFKFIYNGRSYEETIVYDNSHGLIDNEFIEKHWDTLLQKASHNLRLRLTNSTEP